jgi:hypothetical protein
VYSLASEIMVCLFSAETACLLRSASQKRPPQKAAATKAKVKAHVPSDGFLFVAA